MILQPAEGNLWRMWSFEPSVIVTVCVCAAWYACGVWRLWRSAPESHTITWRQMVYASMAALTVVIALFSPLDAMSDDLFSAHMVQHLLLVFVVAPLIVLADPVQPALWAFPRRWRRGAGRWWMRHGRIRMAALGATAPATVWALHVGTLLFWHIPQPYGWALANETIHAIEHATFVVTSALFWWVVFQPIGRRALGYGTGVLYVSSAGAVMGALGAILTFAPIPWYAGHLATTAAWHLTPLQDQQLAGVIMWAPGCFPYLIAAVALMAKWIDEAPTRRRALVAVRPLALLLMAVAGGALTSCREGAGAPQRVTGGDADRGKVAFERIGCGACHIASGIRTAVGTVGPPLSDFGKRVFIAGEIPNTPENLVRWIEAPQSIAPGGAMPNLGVSERDARDIAAYLLTLR